MRSIIVKNKKIIFKLFTLFFISLVSGFLGYKLGLNFKQVLAICVFLFSIGGTLFFWNFRLSFAFFGTSILLISSTINLEDLIKSSSLEVILFLVGMMILIGLLKYSGFFAWLVMFVLRIKNLNSFKFFIYICVFSAILACAVDEVTSIIFMIAAILQICDFFEISPVPFIIISVLTTNIGSSGTVLGNPIGIIIATRAKLTFEDFILNAFPIMLACLVLTMFLLFFYYRSYLKEFNKKIKEFGKNEIFLKLISVPPDRNLRISLVIFLFSLFFIALHHRLELLLNLEVNTILLVVPLFFSAIVMVWKHKEARYFVETDVEWWTLLFFLFLFVQVGALKSTGVIDIFAEKISLLAGQKYYILNAVILWLSAIGSSVLDNVVLITAIAPVIQSFSNFGFKLEPLWWSLLFGGCLGGNITLIGSTANIVALGILEKEKKLKIKFWEWFKVGLLVGIFTTFLVWIILSFYKKGV